MRNTWIIARTTLGDALRKRVLLVFMMVAVVTLLLAMMLTYLTAREQRTAFLALELVIILIFGTLIAVTTAIFLIPDEIERRTIYSLLSKPVQRWEFFLGKFLGGVLTAGVCLALMTLVLIVVVFLMAMRQPESALGPMLQTSAEQEPLNVAKWFQRGGQDVALVLRGAYVIFFQLVLVTAVATTLSLFVSPTVNFSLTMFLFIVGQVQFVLKAALERNELPLTKVVVGVLYYLTPHFHDFNIMGSIIHSEVRIPVNHWLFAGEVSLYGLMYALFVAMLGILVFDRKEV